MAIINLDELKQQQQQEVDNKTEQSTDIKEVKPAVTNDVGAGSENKESATSITLTGPLSQMYTKALNLIYANENILEIRSTMDGTDTEQITDTDTKDLYLYCCDEKNVDLADVSDKLNIALDSGYKKVGIVTECDTSRVSRNLAALESLARDLKVKMYFSKKTAMEAVKIAIENHV